jgi:hypothetical protein
VPRRKQEELAAALRAHEAERNRLAAELRHRDSPPASPGPDHHAVYVSAQILRHRIAMALLASRLALNPSDPA